MTREDMERLTLEEAMECVDRTLNELSEDLPLERSFELYREGIELLKYCDGKLKGVEGQILKMDEEGELNEF